MYAEICFEARGGSHSDNPGTDYCCVFPGAADARCTTYQRLADAGSGGKYAGLLWF